MSGSQQPIRQPSSEPSREPAGAGRDTARVVEAAVREVEGRPQRDPETGRWLPGNTAAGQGLTRSAVLWEALAGAKAGLVERLRSDLAVDGRAAATLEGLVDAFAEATLLRRSLFLRMSEQGGAVTAKGKTRALFNSYLSALDRERRLALDLGLERRARSVDPVEAVRRAVAEANR